MGCPLVQLWPFLAERLSTIHLVVMIKKILVAIFGLKNTEILIIVCSVNYLNIDLIV